MERLALELVDSGIVTVSSRGKVSLANPGLAISDGDQLEIGLDAASNARLKPRRLHSRFWQQLSTRELGRPYPGHLRTADLAHAHLSQIWDATGRTADEVIMAVPGTFSGEQLGLLLGIAQACTMPARGLVDVAVASCADRETRRHCLHLDFHLHRAVLTVLEHGDEVVRRSVVEESQVGLVNLYDLWARAISRHFVRTTRFDPLHQAATEQILYIQLHTHLATLADRQSAEVAISSGGRRHSIEIERRELVEAASHPYDIVRNLISRNREEGPITLLLGDRAAALPGLAAHLSESEDMEIVALHPAAAGSTALNWAEIICSEGPKLRLITRLPGYDAKKPAPMTVAVDRQSGNAAHENVPTHVVINGVAHQLSSQALGLTASNETAPTDGSDPEIGHLPRVRIDRGRAIIEAPPNAQVFINGEAIRGPTEVVTGDRLRVGSNEILLVTLAK